MGLTASPTPSQTQQVNAGKAYADRMWKENSPIAKYWKSRVGTNYGASSYTDTSGKSHSYSAHTETASEALASFEGYEQWIEQQGMQLMQQVADDMGSDDG